MSLNRIRNDRRHAIYTLAINKLAEDTYPYLLCVAIQAAVYELYPHLARAYDPIRHGLDLYPEIMVYKPEIMYRNGSWFDPADKQIRFNILRNAAARTELSGTKNK